MAYPDSISSKTLSSTPVIASTGSAAFRPETGFGDFQAALSARLERSSSPSGDVQSQQPFTAAIAIAPGDADNVSGSAVQTFLSYARSLGYNPPEAILDEASTAGFLTDSGVGQLATGESLTFPAPAPAPEQAALPVPLPVPVPEPAPLPASLKGDEPTLTNAMPTHVTASMPDRSDEELTPPPDGAAMLMMTGVPAPVSVPVAGVKDTIVPAPADTRPAVSGSAAVPTGISPEPAPLPASPKGDEPTLTDAMPTHVTVPTPDRSDEELTPPPDGAAMLMVMAVPAPVSVPVAGVKDTTATAAADTRPAVSGSAAVPTGISPEPVPTPDRSDEELTPPPDGAAMLMMAGVPAPVSVPVAGVKDTIAPATADTRTVVSGSAAVPTGISPEPATLPTSLKGDEPTPTDAMPTHVTASTPDRSDEELTPPPDGAAMLMMMAVPAPVSVPVAGVKDTIVPAPADTRPAVSGDRVTTSTATASTTLSLWGDVATTAEADAGASTTSPLQQDSQDSWRPTSAAESFAVSPPPVLMAAVAGEGVTVSPGLSPEAFAPSVPPEVQTPVGDPGWPDELGGTLSLMLDKTLQNAEIRLNPQHLGPLQVSIRMENDQVAIQFSSEQAAVREALEAAAPRLRDLLAGQQLTVADVSVNTPEPQPRPDGGNAFAGFERQSRSPYPQQERFGQVDNTRSDDPEPTRIQVPVPGLPNQSISFYA